MFIHLIFYSISFCDSGTRRSNNWSISLNFTRGYYPLLLVSLTVSVWELAHWLLIYSPSTHAPAHTPPFYENSCWFILSFMFVFLSVLSRFSYRLVIINLQQHFSLTEQNHMRSNLFKKILFFIRLYFL